MAAWIWTNGSSSAATAVVYFDGALPSQAQHHILLQDLTDFAGLQETWIVSS
jgi:hypothetical protein